MAIRYMLWPFVILSHFGKCIKENLATLVACVGIYTRGMLCLVVIRSFGYYNKTLQECVPSDLVKVLRFFPRKK
jgi:hypothetical protein